MRSLGWTGFATFALLVGCNLLKKDGDGDAGSTATAAAAESGLPPECETFLTRYSCFLKKNGKPTTEADDMRREWTPAVANPAVRPTIVDVCKKQLATQGAAFDKAGCTASAAVAAATPGIAAPVAKAASTAVTTTDSGAATPKPTTCKADSDCGKGPRDKCIRWGLKGNPMCATICNDSSEKCPIAGEVCEPMGHLADYSGIVGFCAKAPHNIAFGGACKSTLDCVKPEKCIKGPDGTFCRHNCNIGKCQASDEECSKDEGNEMPDEGHEGKEFCVKKKGFSGAVTTCPSGQEWYEEDKTCAQLCSASGKPCPAGTSCKMTGKTFGHCMKQ